MTWSLIHVDDILLPTSGDLPLTGVDAAVVKQAHAAVATLLLEAAKHDADATAIRWKLGLYML